MDRKTARKNVINPTKQPNPVTRWIPRPLEQLEDRLTPTVILSNSPTWADVGPNSVTGSGGQVSNIPNSPVIGAIQVVAPDLTDLSGNTLYAGGVNGGVWKTTNALAGAPIWTPLTDSFQSLSISSISINPDNNLQILAGIDGTADGAYSINANDGSQTVLDSRGQARGDLIGALYSEDGGATWRVLNNNIGGQHVVDVAVRGTTDANSFMLVATTAGVYRSVDAGATFTLVTPAAGLASGGVFDLMGDPGAAVNPIASASWASGTATITTAVAHNLIVGQSVIITGVNPSGYNGTVVVTSQTANSFTYALAINPGFYISGGRETANPNADPLARTRFYVAIRSAGDIGGVGVYRTDNGGLNWGNITSVQMQIGATTTAVKIAVFNSGIITNNIVYVAVENSFPTGSEQAGNTSQATTTGRDYAWINRRSAVSTINWSPNQGGTWTRMDAPRTITENQDAYPTNTYPGEPAGNYIGSDVRHHLRTGDEVIITDVFNNDGPPIRIPRRPDGTWDVNGTWYVRVVDEYTFQLMKSALAPGPLIGSYTGAYLGGDPQIFPNGKWRQIIGANPGERPEFINIVADPNNSNILYMGTDRTTSAFYGNSALGATTYTGNYWRGDRFANPTGPGNTTRTSNQWVKLVNEGTPNGSAPPADSRNLVVGANGQLIAATGGGLYRLSNPTAPTPGTWGSLNGNLGVADVFSVAYDSLNNRYFAGTIDTQGITQVSGGAYSSTITPTLLNLFDQGNVFKVAVDNSGIDQFGNPIAQTVRYFAGTNFEGIIRQTVNASGVVTSTSRLNFASTLTTGIPLSGLSRDTQSNGTYRRLFGLNVRDSRNDTENVHIAMALNQNDPRRGIFGYNGLYEDADPSGSTPTGAIINDVTPLGMTGHVESLLYGGKRGGIKFNQVVYMTTSTGELWVRGEFGPIFTKLATGQTGSINSVIGDPDDYTHIFVVQGNKILESKDFGLTFVDISDNLIGPVTADGTAGPGRLTTEIRSLAVFDSNPGAAVAGDLTLLAGGRGGVFRLSTGVVCNGGSWSEYGLSLPNTVVQDLQVFGNQRLIAGTGGRGIWQIDDITTTVAAPTVLTIAGTAGNDIITVSLDPNNSNIIQVYDGTSTTSYTRGSFSTLSIYSLGGADTIIIDSKVDPITHLGLNGDVSFVNFNIIVDGGGDVGDTLYVYGGGLTTAVQVSITDTTIGVGAGDTIFNGCGGISYAGFNSGTIDVTTGIGSDTFVLSSLMPGQTTLRGGNGSETYRYAMNPASPSTLTIIDGGTFGIDTLSVTGTAGNDNFSVTPNQVTLGNNVVNYDPTVENLIVSGGDGDDTITVYGVGSNTNTFNGNAGNDNVTFLSSLGSAGKVVTVNGGAGIDTYTIGGVGGDESIGVDITSAFGNGTVTGLRQTATFSDIQNFSFDGGTGTNTLTWRDRTNGSYGTPLSPELGIVYAPTTATSGNVRVGTGVSFPKVFFTNINGAFILNGDPDGSGDRDTVTVLGMSTAGLESGSPFNEPTSVDGSDAFNVSDQSVEVTNTALGSLRSVLFGAYPNGTPTFKMIHVRGGNEAVTGDRFTVTPSLRTNILINGMNPATGATADLLTINSVGDTTRSLVNDPAVGPQQTRVVQSSDGASVGYFNIERVSVFDSTGGGGGGGGGGGSGGGGGINSAGFFLAGSDVGAPSEVRVFDRLTGVLKFDLNPFGAFTGGVRVATGDVNGDGTPDIVVTAGPGGGPAVKIFSGIDGTILASFYAYGSTFAGGVDVAVADLNGDGFAEIVTGSGIGAGPHIKVFDGITFEEKASYYAFEPTFTGGIRVAVGDTNGDGTPDLIVGAQSGGGPRVTVFSGRDNSVLQNFFAFDEGFGGGVFVACGDVNGDGFADVIIGAGSGGLPAVSVVDGRTGVHLTDFFANDELIDTVGSVPYEGGVRVAAVDIDNNGVVEILTAKGPGTFPVLRFFKYSAGNVFLASRTQAFGDGYANGVFVGG